MGLIQVTKGIFSGKYMNFAGNGTHLGRDHSTYYYTVEGTPEVRLLDGTLVEDGKLKANQTAIVTLGTVNVKKYHLLVEVNPTLYAGASVNARSIYEPYEGETAVQLFLKTHKAVDVHAAEYLVRIYGQE